MRGIVAYLTISRHFELLAHFLQIRDGVNQGNRMAGEHLAQVQRFTLPFGVCTDFQSECDACNHRESGV